MSRSEQRPPRRPILGILFLSISALTVMSLPAATLGRSGGPFAEVWVRFWIDTFGLPAVWVLAAAAAAWGLAFLFRWPRGWLWRLAATIWLIVVIWDAWLISLRVPQTGSRVEGLLGRWLARQTMLFFGAGSTVQTSLALGAGALACALVFMRWCLPRPLCDWTARAIAWATVAGQRAVVFIVRGLFIVMRFIAVAMLWPLARFVVRAAGALATLLFNRARAIRLPRRVVENDDASAHTSLAIDDEDLLPRARAISSPVRAAPVDASDEGTADGGATWADAHAEDASPAQAAETAAPLSPQRSRGLRRVALAPGAAIAVADVPRTHAAVYTDGRPAIAPLDLLAEPAGSAAVSADEIRENAARLKETLSSFGIHGEIGEVHPGPVITQYEFMPGAGVTISQISSRQDDLALALRATRVRLVTPIPGKAAVGVEIPNHEPALISFKEIVSRREFLEARSPLAVALGKDVAGRPFYAALDAMPHLLVAGTTGSGKSVCLNTIIAALLLRCDPNVLRFLLIDPKMLELTVYNGIPHLLKPVLTDSRESARALQWLTREMERRYRVFAGLGVRNIEAFRRRAREDPRAGEEPLEPMPYIVVVVDELADLMMSNQTEVELPIARLAQMARAVGIHLVLATQRPSVDVITGVIKANFPARIAFQVASRTDSRTILDMNGAEALIGRGDMLYIPPGKAQAHRVHGAYISDAEIEGIAAYLRQFPPPEALPNPIDAEEEGCGVGEMDDPLYPEAFRIVVGSQQGSTSFLQRRLRIGYTRAGRLMDMLEHAGVVGPPDGSRARDVLVTPDHLDDERSDESDEQQPR